MGLGAGALALLICCGGGGTALVALSVSSIRATEEQGQAITDEYYGALVRREYGKAYDTLCDAVQRRESRAQFVRRVTDEPAVAAYRVGAVDPNTLTVPVEVTFSGGGQETQTVTLAPDQQTAGLEVCGVN
ncbi:hypothetical protein E1165_27275 [Micromonospora sp. KC723]|nr:hypothetical protein E1165_27275 [Micromonospora sp. KC723]